MMDPPEWELCLVVLDGPITELVDDPPAQLPESRPAGFTARVG